MKNNIYSKPSVQNSQPRQNWTIKLVVIVVGMAVVYSAVRLFLDRNNYNQGHEAYRKISCTEASEHFDRVINGRRILDLGGYAALAQQEKSECLEFIPASSQEQTGHFGQALLPTKTLLISIMLIVFWSIRLAIA
jgi:hypothetical protein